MVKIESVSVGGDISVPTTRTANTPDKSTQMQPSLPPISIEVPAPATQQSAALPQNPYEPSTPEEQQEAEDGGSGQSDSLASVQQDAAPAEQAVAPPLGASKAPAAHVLNASVAAPQAQPSRASAGKAAASTAKPTVPPLYPTSLFPPFFEGGDGGTVTVRVSASEMGRTDIFPTCCISVGGENLHAPLIERLFELPMDVYEGRLNGCLEIFLKTKEEWTRFPRFGGNVEVSNGSFHFWDSPDDFSGTDLDLKFEDTTCHIVSSRGRFGAAEIAATGTVGMNPETGEYDISAEVSPTDVNAVRATLGARPLPYPAAGAVKGQFTCYGALENPIFSGRLKSVREGAWEGTPQDAVSDAQKVLEDSRSAGDDAHIAYDKIAIMCASDSLRCTGIFLCMRYCVCRYMLCHFLTIATIFCCDLDSHLSGLLIERISKFSSVASSQNTTVMQGCGGVVHIHNKPRRATVSSSRGTAAWRWSLPSRSGNISRTRC